MAESGAIRAGKAFVELFADDSKLARGLKAAEFKVKAFGKSIKKAGIETAALGAAITAPLLAASKVFASMGDDVAKMADRTGVAVEALSELRYAAELSGASAEDLENGIRKMQRSIVDAGDGLSTAVEALERLGLTVGDLKDLSPEQQFKLIADRLAAIEDPTLKAATAMELFGKSGTKLLPLMKDGVAGMERLQAEARKLGLTISGEDARAAERFNDTMDTLGKVLKINAFNIGSALAPALTKVFVRVTEAAAATARWIKQHQGLIVSLLGVGAALTAAGVAMVAAGVAVKGLALAIGVLRGAVGVFHGVASVALTVLGAMLSPIGLVTAAVAGLGAVLLYQSGLGGKALAWLKDRFTALAEDARMAFGLIGEAMASGDLAGAARVLWALLKIEWDTGINYLERAWLGFKDTIVRVAVDMWDGVRAAAAVAWQGIRIGWDATQKWLSNQWLRLMGQFDSTFDVEAAIKINEDDFARSTLARDQEYQQRMAEIGRQNLDAHKALDEEYARRIAENERELESARKAWRDAIAEAKKRSDSARIDAALEDFWAGGERVADQLEDAAETMAKLTGVSVSGTFNPAAILSLQSNGSVAERTARAAEETARNTGKIASAAATGGLVFT